MMFIIVIGFFFHANPASVCNITESSDIDQHQKAAWFLKTTGQCEEKAKRLFPFVTDIGVILAGRSSAALMYQSL